MRLHGYALKKDGRYWTGCSGTTGFFARGIGGCYAYSIEEARALRDIQGGEIVEVIHIGEYRYQEGEAIR